MISLMMNENKQKMLVMMMMSHSEITTLLNKTLLKRKSKKHQFKTIQCIYLLYPLLLDDEVARFGNLGEKKSRQKPGMFLKEVARLCLQHLLNTFSI